MFTEVEHKQTLEVGLGKWQGKKEGEVIRTILGKEPRSNININ